VLVAADERRHVGGLERPGDELVQAVAVALLERRSLRLPVVGQDHDLVGPRCVPARPGDAPELMVQLAQRLERVGTLEAGVVRDLVVARERCVDGGSATHHVGQHRLNDQIAHDDAHRGAHERVGAATVPARPDVATSFPEGGRPLEEHLPEEQDEDAHDVEAVGEERAVAGVRPFLRLDPADGEDHLVRLPREKVAAARAAVEQEALVARVPPLELRAVRRSRARHHRGRLLLDPPERGDVDVRAEQDARLARAGLRGEVGLPGAQGIPVLAQPAGHVRRVAVAQCTSQDRERESVDLEEDDTGRVGADRRADPARDSLDDPVRKLAVVVDPGHDLDHERHRGREERDEKRPPEAVDTHAPVGQSVGGEQHEGVEHENREEPEHERQRQPDRRDDRREDRVERRDHRCDDERRQEPVDMRAGDDPGRDEQSDRRDDPRPHDVERPEAQALLAPAVLGRGRGRRLAAHRRTVVGRPIGRACSRGALPASIALLFTRVNPSAASGPGPVGPWSRPSGSGLDAIPTTCARRGPPSNGFASTIGDPSGRASWRNARRTAIIPAADVAPPGTAEEVQ
jgi:hypothetical protein